MVVIQNRKETTMAKKCNKIGAGSVIDNFALISCDEDTGHMLIRKKLDGASEWCEPVAMSFPDLFYLFNAEGVNPTDMVGETSFEFNKVRVEIGNLTQAPFDDDFNCCSDSYYYQVKAIRP